jgi:hypothetical protein
MLKCMTTQVKLYTLKSPRTSEEDRCVKYKLHKVFYDAVDSLGCSAYKAAQAEACSCRKDFTVNLEAMKRPPKAVIDTLDPDRRRADVPILDFKKDRKKIDVKKIQEQLDKHAASRSRLGQH